MPPKKSSVATSKQLTQRFYTANLDCLLTTHYQYRLRKRDDGWCWHCGRRAWMTRKHVMEGYGGAELRNYKVKYISSNPWQMIGTLQSTVIGE
jgi:hypothetical protein